jgi:hypothetical protein
VKINVFIFSVVTSTLLHPPPPLRSLGAFPVLSLMVSAVVTTMVPEKGDAVDIPGFDGKDKEQKRVLVASSMTFLVGMYQVGPPRLHHLRLSRTPTQHPACGC